MATQSDALTGSGTLGANWTVTGTWERTASGARTTAGTLYLKAAFTGAAMDSDDYTVTVTVAYDSDASRGMGVAARWQSGVITCYGAIRFATEVYRVELTAGAETEAVLVSTPGTGSRTLAIEVDGSAIEVFVGGASVGTDTDASITGGQGPGLVAYNADAAAPNYATTWSAVDLAAAATSRALFAQPRLPAAILAI